MRLDSAERFTTRITSDGAMNETLLSVVLGSVARDDHDGPPVWLFLAWISHGCEAFTLATVFGVVVTFAEVAPADRVTANVAMSKGLPRFC